MHQKTISPTTKRKADNLLTDAGFNTPTPLQRKVFPVFFQKKDIIAGSNGAKGKRSSYIIPILINLETHKDYARALVIVSEPENVYKVKAEFARYLSVASSNLTIVELVSDSTIRRELKILSSVPDIIIGTPQRIIDHIRRENLDLGNIETVVVDTPLNLEENGFDQDLFFIFSKMPQRHQNIFFTDNLDTVSLIEPMVKRPVIISMENHIQENLKMKNEETQIIPEQVEKNIKDFINTIITEENPDVLNNYKKLFKKYTPITKRGYLSAYLLKIACNGGVSRRPQRRTPDPDKTTLFISIGKNRKVFPKDLARLFQSRLDLEPSEIGTIKILDSYSFLDISKAQAEKAIEALNGEDYKGKKLTVNHAKKRENSRG